MPKVLEFDQEVTINLTVNFSELVFANQGIAEALAGADLEGDHLENLKQGAKLLGRMLRMYHNALDAYCVGRPQIEGVQQQRPA